jgi:nucleotide-binding universal stress UspA family protein
MTKKQNWIWIVILVAVIVASIHFFIPEKYLTLHIALRLLYFIPIVFAALYSGRKGGLLVALGISLIFLPHFFISGASSEFITGNVVALILFNLCGFFIGVFRESSATELSNRIQKTQIVPDRGKSQQKVLFYIDGTPLSLSAAEWFANRSWVVDLSFVLLAIFTDSREEITEAQKSGRPEAGNDENVRDMTNNIQLLLSEKGVPDGHIETVSTSMNEKIPVSTKVLEYANKHDVDVILICKHNKKKSEEFLFGDTAIQVVRKTTIPVMVVKGIEDKFVLA